MAKTRSFQWRKGLIPAIILLIILFGIANVYSSSKENPARSDIIGIDLPPVPGGEQMPAVQFLHDRHTEALDGKKSCSFCHERQDDRLVFKFKRSENTTPEKDMAVYHDNCIGCHVKTAKTGEPAGPVTGDCRSCHNRKSTVESSWQPIRFDKTLHYRHESSQSIQAPKSEGETNCDACHHIYDEAAQKAVYEKGKEENCVYCHKSLQTEKASSIRTASHAACVSCHESLAGRQVVSGPVTCQACHDEKARKKIEPLNTIPRLKRNQPDMTLIASWLDRPEITVKAAAKQMDPVPFNHERHENKVESCLACHHESLQECSVCHTEIGDDKGGFVRLDQAMHNIDSEQSCIGCHQSVQQEENCAGCHEALMPRTPFANENCVRCHAADKTLLEPLPVSREARTALADDLFDAQKERIKRVPDARIPETVTIGAMASEYASAALPHRRIVRSLESRIAASGLAQYFHREATTLCMGCHHNSPATFEPPKCASCHGEAFKGLQDDRPGLKGAYHGQCIECHQAMNIQEPAATDCIKCHQEKK